MIPATHDFSVMRGTSGPTQGLVFALKAADNSNIPVQDIRLNIYQRKSRLLLATYTGGQIVLNDIATNEFAWVPTTDDTRLIPIGARATYELEVWNAGTQIVYLIGTITGIGGINDDVDGS